MSRLIFTTLGALLNLAQLAFPFWAYATGFKIGFKSFEGTDIIIYFFLLVAYSLLVGIVYISNDVVPLTWWFASPKKRICHAELGTLWAEISEREHSTQKEMTIWKQCWLFSKKIAEVEYTDSKELLIQRTKRELDDLHSKRRQKKESKNPAFDEWDGYLDKQSKRDDKLNGIGI